MGNSPADIFRHYRRPLTETSAREYFELRPPIDRESNAVLSAIDQ
jgi:hypothetical protein